ncbi:MAG: terminase small subunit [Acidobacteriota bacterium]|nr:terminase small subunit [Acidobacteriota bacterium]
MAEVVRELDVEEHRDADSDHDVAAVRRDRSRSVTAERGQRVSDFTRLRMPAGAWGLPQMTTKALTIRERRFIDALLGSARANATQAALTAGYTRNYGSARTLGARLLAKVHIRKAVDARAARETKAAILNAEERDVLLSSIARGELGADNWHARIRAISELNKCSGRHSVKHSHDGRLTLEQAVMASRK